MAVRHAECSECAVIRTDASSLWWGPWSGGETDTTSPEAGVHKWFWKLLGRERASTQESDLRQVWNRRAFSVTLGMAGSSNHEKPNSLVQVLAPCNNHTALPCCFVEQKGNWSLGGPVMLRKESWWLEKETEVGKCWGSRQHSYFLRLKTCASRIWYAYSETSWVIQSAYWLSS